LNDDKPTDTDRKTLFYRKLYLFTEDVKKAILTSSTDSPIKTAIKSLEAKDLFN